MKNIIVNDKQINIVEGTLKEFEKYYSDAEFAKNGFLSLVKDENLIPFFAIYKGRMIGKIYFIKKLDDTDTADGKEIGYICNLYVKPKYRHNGIGTALVNCAKEYAKENGFSKICLGVEESELRNVKLYNALGFTNKIKVTNTDMIFKDADGNPLRVNEYLILSSDI